MKKLILFLLLFPALAWGGEPIELARMNPYILGSGVSAAANTCTTWANNGAWDSNALGFQPESGTSWDSGNPGYVFRNDGVNSVVTTPASSKRVCELSIYTKSVTSAGQFRMAILTTSGVPVCEGTALVDSPVDTGAWRGHIGPATLKAYGGADGSACQLDASTDYYVSWYIQDNTVYNLYSATASSQKEKHTVDYDAGFPNPTTLSDAYSNKHYFRVGLSDD